jgi:predicted acetylornithine/succinylornithine family transaminase
MNAAVLEQFQKYVVGNYTRYPVCLVRGEGSRVWDDVGNSYLDLFPGWGCGLIGHCPPRVVRAVQEQVARLIHVPNTWYTREQGSLGEALSQRTGWGGQAFFCNSGTEANEAAIKLARLNSSPGRYKILATLRSFHGRTMGALSATGQPKYHAGVGPLLPGFVHVPFGDLAAMTGAVDAETCAIIVEPIQGEGGINIPPAGYLEGLRALCDKHGLLLIFDEVQTGMGRTGKWFGHQYWPIAPDVMTLAKALAGGVACGAMIAKEAVAAKLKPGTHAATFGGNPLACAAALATIETIEADGLLDHAVEMGKYFQERFTALKARCPIIQEVRTRGAMIGIQLSIEGTPLVQACLERRLLINCTQGSVIRLLPAMNLSSVEMEEGASILEQVLLQHAG